MLHWSNLDNERFNLKTAKLSIDKSYYLQEILENFRKKGGELLIAQCDTSYSKRLFNLFEAGFILTDTTLTYSMDVESAYGQGRGTTSIDIYVADEAINDTLGEIASRAFHNYQSHYHNNPRLDRERCDEVYVDWAKNLVLRDDMADIVFACSYDGHIAGFSSLQIENEVGIAGLLCVDPNFKGKGIAKGLHQERLKWCREKNIKEFRVETSINNETYIRLLTNLGYRFHSAKYILHLNNF